MQDRWRTKNTEGRNRRKSSDVLMCVFVCVDVILLSRYSEQKSFFYPALLQFSIQSVPANTTRDASLSFRDTNS